MVDFVLLFWNVLFCLYCLVLSWYLFSLPFACIFWVGLHKFFSVLVAVLFQFRPILSLCSVLVFLLVVVVFLSAVQVWVPTQVLTFCLWSTNGTRFFLWLVFYPAYIKPFISMMLFVGIFIIKLFNFSVSDLTVLQSCFLREDNVVFFSDMII